MKVNSHRMTLGLLVALAGTCTAFCQPSWDREVADFTLLTLEPVKKELNLTAAQRAKMNAHAQSYNVLGKKIEAKLAKNQKISDAEQKQLAKAREDLRQKVLNELTPTQLVRLRQITLQQAGLVALGSEEVVRKLGISAPVAKKLRDTINAGLEQSSKILQDVRDRLHKEFAAKQPKTDAERKKVEAQFNKRLDEEMTKAKPKVSKVAEDTERKALALLTATQRSGWATLLGKPFAPN